MSKKIHDLQYMNIASLKIIEHFVVVKFVWVAVNKGSQSLTFYGLSADVLLWLTVFPFHLFRQTLFINSSEVPFSQGSAVPKGINKKQPKFLTCVAADHEDNQSTFAVPGFHPPSDSRTDPSETSVGRKCLLDSSSILFSPFSQSTDTPMTCVGCVQGHWLSRETTCGHQSVCRTGGVCFFSGDTGDAFPFWHTLKQSSVLAEANFPNNGVRWIRTRISVPGTPHLVNPLCISRLFCRKSHGKTCARVQAADDR